MSRTQKCSVVFGVLLVCVTTACGKSTTSSKTKAQIVYSGAVSRVLDSSPKFANCVSEPGTPLRDIFIVDPKISTPQAPTTGLDIVIDSKNDGTYSSNSGSVKDSIPIVSIDGYPTDGTTQLGGSSGSVDENGSMVTTVESTSSTIPSQYGAETKYSASKKGSGTLSVTISDGGKSGTIDATLVAKSAPDLVVKGAWRCK